MKTNHGITYHPFSSIAYEVPSPMDHHYCISTILLHHASALSLAGDKKKTLYSRLPRSPPHRTSSSPQTHSIPHPPPAVFSIYPHPFPTTIPSPPPHLPPTNDVHIYLPPIRSAGASKLLASHMLPRLRALRSVLLTLFFPCNCAVWTCA